MRKTTQSTDDPSIVFVGVAKKTKRKGLHFKCQDEDCGSSLFPKVPFDELVVGKLDKVKGNDFSTFNTLFLPQLNLKWFVTKRRQWIYVLVLQKPYPYGAAVECLEDLVRGFASLKSRGTPPSLRTACCQQVSQEWGTYREGSIAWDVSQEIEADIHTKYKKQIAEMKNQIVVLERTIELQEDTEQLLRDQLRDESQVRTRMDRELKSLANRTKSISSEAFELKEMVKTKIAKKKKRKGFGAVVKFFKPSKLGFAKKKSKKTKREQVADNKQTVEDQSLDDFDQ